MSEIIKSRVIKTANIEWQALKFIQSDDFKQWVSNGDKKLLESIVKYQFIDPFKVWEHDETLYCLDGKHRFLDLQFAVENGFEVPNELPATFIDCTDIKEASELVLVYSSLYAKATANSISDFIKDLHLDFEEMKGVLELPGIDLNILNDQFLPPPSEAELIGLLKHKPITLNITFKSKEQIDLVESQIKDLLTEHCPGAYYSVSAGEL